MVTVKKIINLLIILILTQLVLTNCSCQWHLQRVENKCGKSAFVDTLLVHDTTIIPKVESDTVFKYFQKDTVVIREGRLTMKYFYNTHDSTVYLNGKCDTIFIHKEIKVPYTKYEIVFSFWRKYKLFIIGIVVLLALYLLNKYSK